MSNINQFINIDWEKYVGRKTDLQKAISFSLFNVGGVGKYFKKNIISKQLYYFNGRTTSIYFSRKEHSNFLKKIYKKLENINFIKKLEKDVLIISKKSLNKAERLSNLINQEKLLKNYKEFKIIFNNYYPVAWTFFFIAGFENIIKEKLLKRRFSEKAIEDILKISSKPYLITPLMESEIEILKLAKLINEKSDKAENKAKELSSKYGWMSVYNTDDPIRSPYYYIKEAEKIIKTDIDKKLKTFKREKEENEIKFKRIIKEISDPLLREQLRFIHLSGFLRDKREEVRDKLIIYQKSLYQSIARKYKFSLKEIINLTDNEIEKLLTQSTDVHDLKRKVRKRLERYMFVIENSNITILDSDVDIKKIVDKIKINDGIKEIKGQVAYKSPSVKGIVRIILSNKELDKIKKGDILVATMTKPDYLTAMKKARAFITDEGGITCHVAIIARELKKPCITGTKIATRVLKDGDLVEVDANRGIVKIIK